MFRRRKFQSRFDDRTLNGRYRSRRRRCLHGHGRKRPLLPRHLGRRRNRGQHRSLDIARQRRVDLGDVVFHCWHVGTRHFRLDRVRHDRRAEPQPPRRRLDLFRPLDDRQRGPRCHHLRSGWLGGERVRNLDRHGLGIDRLGRGHERVVVRLECLDCPRFGRGLRSGDRSARGFRPDRLDRPHRRARRRARGGQRHRRPVGVRRRRRDGRQHERRRRLQRDGRLESRPRLVRQRLLVRLHGRHEFLFRGKAFGHRTGRFGGALHRHSPKTRQHTTFAGGPLHHRHVRRCHRCARETVDDTRRFRRTDPMSQRLQVRRAPPGRQRGAESLHRIDQRMLGDDALDRRQASPFGTGHRQRGRCRRFRGRARLLPAPRPHRNVTVPRSSEC
ncbi:Hypothetical protein AJAP_23010 [Amycolatopsis japonica]|uniref:Uncharacterized protein n=1 Tax=Amycolatopsis japonica TaxID=208439 RepID=A0A075UTD2_9PSEU|nr:Hypothetical protein AJAP_23010 [Amycolatopsis japonica]